MPTFGFENPRIQHLLDSNRAVGMLPTSPELVSLVDKLEGRSIWLKSGALSFIGSHSNVRKITDFFHSQAIEVDVIGLPETEQAKAFAVEYKPLTEPFEIQAKALDFLAAKTSACIFSEQGTGKTKVAIDHACRLYLNKEINATIIVAPRGVHRQWINSELPKHCGIPYEGFVFEGKPKSWVGGCDKALFISLTYGKLGSIEAQAWLEYLKSQFDKILFVIDESHFIKNPATKRWKACYSFSKSATYRVAMTGTPIAKKLTDEWAQLKVVDENVIGIDSKAAFEREFVPDKRRHSSYYGLDPSNDPVERFKRLTRPIVFRATKADMGMAPKTYSNWAFDMTEDQRKHMKDMADTLMMEIEEKNLTLEFACMAVIKLRQIASGFIIDKEKQVHHIMPLNQNPRLAALKDILDGYNEPIIVWYHHIEDGRMIEEYLNAYGTGYLHYHKGLSPNQREDVIKQWSENKEDTLLANPASGGTGLNLHYGGCRLAVFFSHNDNSIQRWQAEDRIHRSGQKGICEYINLIASGSPDLITLARTAEKKALADYTLDDIKTDLRELMEGLS